MVCSELPRKGEKKKRCDFYLSFRGAAAAVPIIHLERKQCVMCCRLKQRIVLCDSLKRGRVEKTQQAVLLKDPRRL